jgi:hypothetical protein
MSMTDPLTGGRLHAAEVNAEAELQDFRESLASIDNEPLASTLGVSAPELLESLGLKEFSGLLNNPPPGLDELVAWEMSWTIHRTNTMWWSSIWHRRDIHSDSWRCLNFSMDSF